MTAPKISVVMSVYNGLPFVGQAVESILNQSWEDLEFIIVDDGSTDATWETLVAYAQRDERIIALRHQPNWGVVRALNRGLERAKGELIARQDADDISRPQRLEQQLAFLENNPDHGLVGAVPQLIDAEGHLVDLHGWDAKENGEIQSKLLDYMCLCGPSIMIRRECLEAVGFGFSEGLDASEDYDVCLRLAEVTKVASLDGCLYLYRQHAISASRKRAQQQMVNKAIALERALQRRFGATPPTELLALAARDYLHAAIIGFAGNDLQAAHLSLTEAQRVFPNVLQQDQPLETLVRAYTPARAIEAALTYTESIFRELLPQTRSLARLKARLLSDLHMGEVFRAKGSGQYELVERHIWRGLRAQPAWLLNRGVLVILVKTTFRLRPTQANTAPRH